MKRISICMAVTCVFLGSGCERSEVASRFDQGPDARVEQARQEIYSKLQAAEYGWKFVYFPRVIDGSTALTQFTYLIDFIDDNRVQMEASNHGAIRDTSEYDVTLGSTLKVRFTTYNFIHELADAGTSDFYRTGGRAAAGDFEFLYYGQDGDDLLMRTNRNATEVRFERATAADWGGNKEPLRDSLAKYFQGRNHRMRSHEGDKLLSDSLLRINLTQRHVSLFNTTATDTIQTSRSGLGYGVNGVVVMPAIKVGEDEFYFFKWNQQERHLTSTLGDKKIKIEVQQ